MQVEIPELVGRGNPAMTTLYSHADFEQNQNAIYFLPRWYLNNKSITDKVPA